MGIVEIRGSRPFVVGIKGGDSGQFPLQRREHATGILQRAGTIHTRECRDKRRGQGVTGTHRSLERVSGADHGVGLASPEGLTERGQVAGIVLEQEMHQFPPEGRIAIHWVQRGRQIYGRGPGSRAGPMSGSSRRAMAVARSVAVMGLAT